MFQANVASAGSTETISKLLSHHHVFLYDMWFALLVF